MTLATVPIVIFVDAKDGTTASLSGALRVKGSLVFDPDDDDVPARLLTEYGTEAGDFECLFSVISRDGFCKLRDRIRANPESYGIEPPDPPEATERAMKGRDVQRMIGGAKR